MSNFKMKYGIDLGTTNSSLCRYEDGKTNIVKTDSLKDTMASCVSFSTKSKIIVGDRAINLLKKERSLLTKSWSNKQSNTFTEFKRTMGLDVAYKSSNTGKRYKSEDLSSEVLKALKSFNKDEDIKSCVITVPAKFKTDQVAATIRAAKLAGIDTCELLQEPIAAAMAYGLSSLKRNGNCLVFDLGGGTFDVALLSIQDGIINIKDTEGDNYLGGKNLDYAIVDEILLPYLNCNYNIEYILQDDSKYEILRNALKAYAEEAKIALSSSKKVDLISQLDELGQDDNGLPLELDLSISESELADVCQPYYEKAIDICKTLLQRNSLQESDIESIILVGGPTLSPILREMLQTEITKNIEYSLDPMTVVAKGAALYATTIDCSDTTDTSKLSKLAYLDIGYAANTIATSEFIAVSLIKDKCKGIDLNNISIEIVRSDKAFTSERVYISNQGEVIECPLQEHKSNSFTINAYENGILIDVIPNQFNIIQGNMVCNAVLPYFIGVDVYDQNRGESVFASLKGLEKNIMIPAVGVRNGLQTQHEIKAGVAKDRMLLPIYQGEFDAEGTLSDFNDHVFDVIITGKDVDKTIPAGTEFDLTIHVDKSQRMTMEIWFQDLGIDIQKEIVVSARKAMSIEQLEGIAKELQIMTSRALAQDPTPNDYSVLNEKMLILNNFISSYPLCSDDDEDRMEMLSWLRQTALVIDKIYRNYEHKVIYSNIKYLINKIEKSYKYLGIRQFLNDEFDDYNDFDDDDLDLENDLRLLERLKTKSYEFLTFGYTGELKKVLQELWFLSMKHDKTDFFVTIISSVDSCFNPRAWHDPKMARKYIDEAMIIINEKGDDIEYEDIEYYVQRLVELSKDRTLSHSEKALLQ